MDGQLASILERAFSNREVAAVQSAGISWNDQNRPVSVDFADGQSIYRKLAIDGDDSRIVRERALPTTGSTTTSMT